MGRRVVVAADGGNSKTDLVLASTDGDVLARVRGAGTQPHRDGVAGTAGALADLVRAAYAEAGVPGDEGAEAGTFYLANVDVADEETAMQAALSEREVASRLEVGNDTFAVLRAGSTRAWGIAVVCGAGINAIGRHPDGRVERFLGIGPWAGDWGGGDGLVVAAVGAAVRAGDGRGPATSLSARIVQQFGMPVDQLAFAAHHDRVPEADLMAFAPVVFEEAATGDQVARGLVDRLGDEIVSFVSALLHRMDLADSDPDVVLGGRVLQARDPLLMERIAAGVRAVAPAGRLRVLDVPPVAGALASALELAGAGPDEITRARGYLLG